MGEENETGLQNEKGMLTERYQESIMAVFGGQYEITDRTGGEKFDKVNFVPNMKPDVPVDELKQKVESALDARLRLAQFELTQAKKEGMALDQEKEVWKTQKAIDRLRENRPDTEPLDALVSEMNDIAKTQNSKDLEACGVALFDKSIPDNHWEMASKLDGVRKVLNGKKNDNFNFLSETNLKESNQNAMENLKVVRGRVLDLATNIK